MTPLRTLFVMMTVMVFFASCGNVEQNAIPIVNIATVESTSGARQADYPARTEARTSTDLSFMVMGTIDKLYVKEGDAVKKGELLARLDTRDYKTQLDATESEYRQIKAECERVIAMYAEHAVSANDYDKARSGLERITAKLEHHRAQLADCEIRAPYNGYVERLMRHDNEIVAPGIPVMTIFTKDGCDIVINIPETEYAQRSNIAEYSAVFSAKPNETMPLVLRSISPKANANQLYEARLSLAREVRDITPGMTAMVHVTYRNNGSEDAKTVVPSGAICNNGIETFVYLFNDEDSTISRTPVVVERILNDGMTVISKGLTVGQHVVASGTHHVSEGQQVRVVPTSSSLNVGNIL